MNKNYKDLTELFSAASLGRELSVTSDFDLLEVFKLANQSNIWLTVFSSIDKIRNDGVISVDSNAFDALKKAVLFKTAKYAAKCKSVHDVIKKLTDAGIDVMVLKGETLARFYANPMQRTSSDTDILIDASDEKKAKQIMSDMGIKIHKKSSVSHHTRCTCEKTGLIELHTDVYEDYIDSVFFDSFPISKDNAIYVDAFDGFKLKTLSANDGLYFNTFHYIKHFLTQGSGLKQAMDLLLYIANFKDEIDAEKYFDTLKLLGFDILIKTTIGIGIKYFKFDKSALLNAEYDDDKVDSLITDIIEAGAFGNGEEGRKGFNEEFLKHKLKDDYSSYKASFNSNFFKKSASFKLNNIYSKYQYAQKNKLLIPIAYIHHIWYIISRSFKHIFAKKAEKAEKNNEVIGKRLDLFKKLDILK